MDNFVIKLSGVEASDSNCIVYDVIHNARLWRYIWSTEFNGQFMSIILEDTYSVFNESELIHIMVAISNQEHQKP